MRSTTRPLSQIYDVALLDLDGVVYIGATAVARRGRGTGRRPGRRDAAGVRDQQRRASAGSGRRASERTRRAGRSGRGDHLVAGGGALPRRAPAGRSQRPGRRHHRTGRGSARARPEPRPQRRRGSGSRGAGLLAEDRLGDARRGRCGDQSRPALGRDQSRLHRPVRRADRCPATGRWSPRLRHATGASPVATGKPDPTMHRESVERSGARSPLVVGDRLDTDIEGAQAVGCPSLLVLTGVTTPLELLAAPAHRRPDYVAHDLRGLLVSHPAPIEGQPGSGEHRCGPWLVDVNGRLSRVDPASDAVPGAADDGAASSALDALRALCAASWAALDDGRTISPTPGDDAAAAALAELRISSAGDAPWR